jgi:hypothetical protein
MTPAPECPDGENWQTHLKSGSTVFVLSTQPHDNNHLWIESFSPYGGRRSKYQLSSTFRGVKLLLERDALWCPEGRGAFNSLRCGSLSCEPDLTIELVNPSRRRNAVRSSKPRHQVADTSCRVSVVHLPSNTGITLSSLPFAVHRPIFQFPAGNCFCVNFVRSVGQS